MNVGSRCEDHVQVGRASSVPTRKPSRLVLRPSCMREMRMAWGAVGLAVVAGLVAVQCGGPVGESPDNAADLGPVQLVAFDSCDEALDGFRRAASKHVGPYGFNDGGGVIALDAMRESTTERLTGTSGGAEAVAKGAPAPAIADQSQGHSTTNVHEQGVDEPDIAKTDGRRLVTVVDGKLRVIDVRTKRLTGTLRLEGGHAQQLLLHGERALVMLQSFEPFHGRGLPPGAEPGRSGVTADVAIAPAPQASRLVLVDVADRPRVVGTLDVDGAYVDARQVGAVARVVTRSSPKLRFFHPDGNKNSEAEARDRNRGVVERSTIEDWLPSYRLVQGGTRSEGQLVDCAGVSRPASYTGSSMLSVLTLDLGRPLGTGSPIGIVADGDTVYATAGSLYVAHRSYNIEPASGSSRMAVPPASNVEVHKLDISGGSRPEYVASGSVAGTLLNQYALSEHDGHLRVATTTGEWTDRSVSGVTVLAQRGRKLVEVGSVGGLGKGERIQAVRFIGPVGYVVTFRQVDPLYTLDLSDPRRPRVVGELKISGYSAYLHPAGENRLIGVGQDATSEGRQLGTQVSLFDVGDPAKPRRIAQHVVSGGHSEVEFDPHAFLYWPADGLVVVPVIRHPVAEPMPLPEPAPEPGTGGGSDGSTGSTGSPDQPQSSPPRQPMPELYAPQSGALVLQLRDGAFRELGFIQHPGATSRGGGIKAPADVYVDPQVRRAIVVGDTLWTVSPSGVMASDIGTLDREAWLPFG
jgi:hypothetical protein